MAAFILQNHTSRSLVVAIEPEGDRVELPTLSKFGIRSGTQGDGDHDVFISLGDAEIEVWCDSPDREIRVSHATNFDLLLRDICVGHGFCGGIVNDKPQHVTDLLPKDGVLSADEFAALVLRADGHGDEDSPAQTERLTVSLKAMFCKHMGSDTVPVTELIENLANPFD